MHVCFSFFEVVHTLLPFLHDGSLRLVNTAQVAAAARIGEASPCEKRSNDELTGKSVRNSVLFFMFVLPFDDDVPIILVHQAN